eukprot:SM000054S18070  [mRNA]  locus=s54:123360:123751:+ [translate_table: standard]
MIHSSPGRNVIGGPAKRAAAVSSSKDAAGGEGAAAALAAGPLCSLLGPLTNRHLSEQGGLVAAQVLGAWMQC